MDSNNIKEAGCCPIFEPAKWDGQTLIWNNKKFIKGNAFTFYYMPLLFGSVISKLFTNIDKSGAICVDNMSLSYHKSPWNMELYLAVDKVVPKEENVTLSGEYYVRVYDAPFKDTSKIISNYLNDVNEKGIVVDKIYNWYTTCPRCARKYGHNYIAILGKIVK